MRDIKKILYMYLAKQVPLRKIADRTGIPYSTVYDNVTLAKAKGFTWPQVDSMSEEALEHVLSTHEKQRPMPDCAYIEKELKRAGVTLQRLWLEYKEVNGNGYQYSRFCELYEAWCKQNDVYSPMPHKAGEELFVDYSGDKISYICLETNVQRMAEVFVAVLGASDRIYAEASESQQLPCWVESNINAFEYNEGVTDLLVPDNLRSAVTKANRYEPSINRTYEEMANHYGIFICPARVVKPKDKSKAELGVGAVQREVLAPLRDRVFFGLDAVNQAMRERLSILNNRPFQKRPGSRESFYQTIEKAALRPLPENRYRYRKWLVNLNIGQDHHVLVDKHSYSAPYKLAYLKVDVTMDINTVELCHKGKVVARHVRSYLIGGRTTLAEHMPPKYRHYFESYDKEKLLIRAQGIGENIFKWAQIVFDLKGRPPKTQCNTVQGALSLVREFGELRLENICARAILLKIHSYKSLRSMLINGADNLPLPILGNTDSHLPQYHENVRGAEHFA